MSFARDNWHFNYNLPTACNWRFYCSLMEHKMPHSPPNQFSSWKRSSQQPLNIITQLFMSPIDKMLQETSNYVHMLPVFGLLLVVFRGPVHGNDLLVAFLVSSRSCYFAHHLRVPDIPVRIQVREGRYFNLNHLCPCLRPRLLLPIDSRSMDRQLRTSLAYAKARSLLIWIYGSFWCPLIVFSLFPSTRPSAFVSVASAAVPKKTIEFPLLGYSTIFSLIVQTERHTTMNGRRLFNVIWLWQGSAALWFGNYYKTSCNTIAGKTIDGKVSVCPRRPQMRISKSCSNSYWLPLPLVVVASCQLFLP